MKRRSLLNMPRIASRGKGAGGGRRQGQFAKQLMKDGVELGTLSQVPFL